MLPIDRSRNRILLAGATMKTTNDRQAAILGIIVQSLLAVQEKRVSGITPGLFRQMAKIRWAELFYGRPGEDGIRHASIMRDGTVWPEPTDVELTEMASRFNDVYASLEMA